MTIAELIRTFNWSRFYEVLAKRVAWVNHLPGIWYASFAGVFGLQADGVGSYFDLGDETAYYRMDGDTTDSSGNGNHATRVGFGPEIRYPLDGDADDVSGNGHDGTPTDITYEASDYGQAAIFNGTSGTIAIPSGIPAGDISISLRFKVPNITATRYLFKQDSAAGVRHLYFTSTNRLYWITRKANGTTSVGSIAEAADWTVDEWTHVVVIQDGTTTRIYVNNVLVDEDTHADIYTSFLPTGDLGSTGSTYWFNGLIDEVRIYDYALTTESVQALYDRPTAPAEFVAGVADRALALNGVDQRVPLPSALYSLFDGDHDFSISIRVTLDTLTPVKTFPRAISINGVVSSGLQFDTTNDRWRFFIGSSIASTPNNSVTTNEAFFVLTFDVATGNMVMYFDGVSYTANYAGATSTPTSIFLGGSGAALNLDGLIDEVHIFDRVITQAERTALNQLTSYPFWIPDPATLAVNYIKSVLVDYDSPLPPVASVAALAAEPSFFWDNDNKLLYIRLEDWDPPGLHNVSPGLIQGFSDRGVVYVDDLYYAPLLMSVPRLGIQQDLQGETRPAFFTGNVELSNTGGDLDELKDDPVYGNDIYIAHLDDDDVDAEGVATRTDLQYLASLYVEDYSIGLRRMVLRVKDRRAAQNIEIPIDRFSADDYPDIDETYVGQVIPLLYSQVREIPATPLSDPAGSGAVDYRVASVMTVLGSVYTLQDEVWTSVSPTASDVATGTFTLAEADGRNASGGLFDCKVVNPIGIPVIYASDVIKDLFDRMLGVTYNSSNYDTTEWEAEETGLTTVGLAITKPAKLYDVIGDLNAGANVVVRFEFLPTGERTIRLDDWSRAVSLHVPVVDIANATAIEADTDTDLLAATVVVEYARSYVTDVALRHEDTSQQETVLNKYRQQPTLTTPTHLINSTHAALRADYDVERFTDVHGLVALDLIGAQYLAMRIYDVITVELGYGEFDLDLGTFTGDREFYGIQKVQVIGVDPDFEAETNKITVVLISDYSYDVLVTTDGDLMVTTTGETRRLP